MENIVKMTGAETYDRMFKALGDVHRIEIMELLREKELSAGEILAAVDVVQSTLSHHMKTLVDAGVVNALRRGKWTYYSLNQQSLAFAAAFLEDLSKGTRKLTESASKSGQAADLSEKETAEKKADNKDASEKEAPKSVSQKVTESTTSVSDMGKKETSEPAANTASEKSEKKKSKKNKKNKKNKK